MSVSRSVYVAHLRRAFLLRAHPDRFRRQDESIRQQQSVLLQVRQANVKEGVTTRLLTCPQTQHLLVLFNSCFTGDRP
jgi:hypothetical protein